MGSKMTRSTYEQMIAENLAWLARMPQCPERVHIEQIVKDSVFRLYDQERERQAPVAWAWNDALGCMHAHCGSRRPVWVDGECSDAKRAETSLRPLYAHPLALREPTDEECKRIAALWNIQGDYNATDLGRAMVRAVKEVLK